MTVVAVCAKYICRAHRQGCHKTAILAQSTSQPSCSPAHRRASQTSSTMTFGSTAGFPPLYTPLRTRMDFHRAPVGLWNKFAPVISEAGLSRFVSYHRAMPIVTETNRQPYTLVEVLRHRHQVISAVLLLISFPQTRMLPEWASHRFLSSFSHHRLLPSKDPLMLL